MLYNWSVYCEYCVLNLAEGCHLTVARAPCLLFNPLKEIEFSTAGRQSHSNPSPLSLHPIKLMKHQQRILAFLTGAEKSNTYCGQVKP